ncbi:MAG: hypothetical protein AB1508_13450 [Pseudomonadota bacterium]
MPFDSRKPRSFVALTGSAALAALLVAGPAHADGDMWNSMLGWVGLGHKQQSSPDDGTIDYRPRPALVVPPKMDLPKPQASTSTPADWPHDPDASARAAAQADSRRPAPSSDSSNDGTSGDFVADADKSKPNASGESETCSNQAGKPICFYGPSDLVNFTKGWGNLDGMFGSHPEDTSKLQVGVEPHRQYLTQPPPGYQMPKVKDEDADDGSGGDADVSKYDSVDVGAPRHHHHNSDDSSTAN